MYLSHVHIDDPMAEQEPFLEDIRNQFIIGIFAAFLISMAFGIYQSDSYPRLFSAMWLLTGLAMIYCIYRAFPDVWNYIFWLGPIYGMTVLGYLSFFHLTKVYPDNRIEFQMIGFMMLFLSLILALFFIGRIKRFRDERSGVIEGPSGRITEKPEAYFPLGLWIVGVLMFWLFGIISAWGWISWAKGESSRVVYILTEFLLLCGLVYILYIPQTKFEWVPEPSRPRRLMIPKRFLIIPRTRRVPKAPTIKAPMSCPVCSFPLVTEKRSCPRCGKVKDFHWCPASELYVIPCSACGKPTSYGKEYCTHCSNRLEPQIQCGCGDKRRIRDWQRVQVAS